MIKISKKFSNNCIDCPSFEDGIFCNVNEDKLNVISSNKCKKLYKKGQALFLEGNPSFGLYCIQIGNIKITKIGDNGKESIVRIAKQGDIVGLRSLFTEEFFCVSAFAIEDSYVCFLEKKFILSYIQQEVSVTSNIIKKLGNELGVSENKLASIYQKNSLGKVTELLLLLKESHGIKVDDIYKITILLTREEMASYLGVASETVIRSFSVLKDEGCIKNDGKYILIVDEEKMLKIANINY
jgi:CRP-like cAMP-binding protein